MLLSERKRNPILIEIITHGYLSTKCIAAINYIHFFQVIRISRNQNRDIQICEPNGICNSFFISKVGQNNDDSFNIIAMLFKKICTLLSIPIGLHPTEFGFILIEHDAIHIKLI